MRTKFKYLKLVGYVLATLLFGIAYAKTAWVPLSDSDKKVEEKKTSEVSKPQQTKEQKVVEVAKPQQSKEKKVVKVKISGSDLGKENNFIKTSLSSPNIENSGVVVMEGEGLNQQNSSNPVYHVNAGDTIYSISKRYGVTPDTLMKLNGINSPKELRVGQVLKVPGSSVNTNITDPEERTSVATTTEVDDSSDTSSISSGDTTGKKLLGEATPNKYRVQSKDTLYSLAKKNNITVNDILQANPGLQVTSLKVGELINIPVPSNQAQADLNSHKDIKIVESKVAEPSPNPSAEAKKEDGKDVANSGDKQLVTKNETLDLKPINFSWPVKGRIVSKYGVSEEGTKNDGIDIFAPRGTPIKAVDDGKVIYIGDQLGNFGNLILIQHANKWVSAYAYTDNVMVSKGQKVNRGDVIARVGINTKSASSQLHFQLRQNKKPVNPADYLVGFNIDNQ